MEKILVVNNDVDTMSLLKNWLEKKSYKVEYTSSRDEVSGIMEKFKPELLLVDVLQKEVVDDIKDNEKTSDVPVILMTGYTLRGHTHTTDVDDIIEKPFNLSLLEKKIEKLIKKNN